MPSTAGTTKARLAKWRSFLRWIDRHSDARWVFRGLGDASFDLIPSIGRNPSYSAAKERTVFTNFQKKSVEFIATPDWKPLDYLALAQHHGLPTRLLDWTTNPLVAAYFAVTSPARPQAARLLTPSGSVSKKAIIAIPQLTAVNARIVAYAVRGPMMLDAGSDPFSVARVGFFVPRSLTGRIVSQSGLFSVHGTPGAPWGDPLTATDAIFDVPADMRAFFRRRLYYIGMEPQRIMGGLDGLGQRLAWQYQAAVGLGALQ